MPEMQMSSAKALNMSVCSEMAEDSKASKKEKSLDTGQAAMLAYTNLDQSTFEDVSASQVQPDWRKSASTRNNITQMSKNTGEFSSSNRSALNGGRFVDQSNSTTSKRTQEIKESLRK
jgi:hypothetical protein